MSGGKAAVVAEHRKLAIPKIVQAKVCVRPQKIGQIRSNINEKWNHNEKGQPGPNRSAEILPKAFAGILFFGGFTKQPVPCNQSAKVKDAKPRTGINACPFRAACKPKSNAGTGDIFESGASALCKHCLHGRHHKVGCQQ